ncbi:hypothetical protein U1Q18_029160 [Sarracenia purpurea var. burkii]
MNQMEDNELMFMREKANQVGLLGKQQQAPWDSNNAKKGVSNNDMMNSNNQYLTMMSMTQRDDDDGVDTTLQSQNYFMHVLYFKDFSPCSISQSSMNGLTSIDWKSYGLTLRSIVDQEGYALLEWENLPPCTHIDIVLHCYDKQVMMPSTVRKNRLDQTLTRKAVKLALNDLKEKNEGALLSTRALKICNYAPDLATTIARLILSSNDSNFQGECHSLLGLQPQEIEGNIIEECIKGKIISAIEINDRKPQRSREAAPSLFEDDYYFQEPDVLDDEYVEGEEAFSYLDL